VFFKNGYSIRMKYAVLGGSFDPVHNGHIHIARAALDSGYDRVIFIPAYQSPFKTRSQGGSADMRMRMLLAAIGGCRQFTVDMCEIEREGISYTIDTIKDIYNRYVPEGKPGLIIGDDIACSFDQWKNAEELASLTDILIARRLNSANPDFSFSHTCIANSIISISSEQLRASIRAGSAWEEYVPPAVRAIITKNKLYKDESCEYGAADKNTVISAASPLPPEIEKAAFAMLDVKRFLHSRNVALHSADLCARYGLPPEKGYCAGIAHDICKGLTDDEFFRLASCDGLPITELEKTKPGMLHGRAAAVLLRTAFKVCDNDILEAVRLHTSGKCGMGPLAQIVYLADKIEAGRRTVDRHLRELAFGRPPFPPLETLFAEVLRATADYLMERGLELAPETLELLTPFDR
jgi:nicotinate-nucleotide adenylyltransferase